MYGIDFDRYRLVSTDILPTLLQVCPCLHLMTQQFAHFETAMFWGHTHEDQVMVRTHAVEVLPLSA